jgi:diadenosine tetraphosphatase ApaH/serine/threonine PP2A family protein phosphatase
MAALRGLGHRACFIRGNADRELAEGSMEYNAPWIRERLDAADLELFDSLDHTLVLDVDGVGPTLFCHGSPRRDDESITTVTPDERLRPMLDGVEQQTVVCGHTHRQFDRRLDGIRIVNAGSVGRPYEGRPGAFWALLGPDVELRRTEYDADAAIDAAYAAGYPAADDMREELRDKIPPADEVARFFEQRALEFEASA